ncbi:MAG: anthranilate phosphoribosyltransferase [Candidatus Omnitrophota bacterium]
MLSRKENLSAGQMLAVMEEIMSGKSETEDIVSFLVSLSNKGETVEELTAAVEVMRKFSTKINSRESVILDTCGTGADKSGTFNISTVACFVASGAGITVAKHGNRSITSCCGSADILEEAGININMGKEKIEECLNKIGIAFLFAPDLHPAMRYAMAARKQIGRKTMFNILGPLSNPAGATHQLMGVFDLGLTETLARVLSNLGSRHALVVHGLDGLDEITTVKETRVSEARQGKINNFELTPEEFGLKRAKAEDLLGGSVGENVKILQGVLEGESGPQRDIVLLNAGAAIYAADKAKTIKDGINTAEKSIDSGAALEKLELLKKYSQQ